MTPLPARRFCHQPEVAHSRAGHRKVETNDGGALRRAAGRANGPVPHSPGRHRDMSLPAAPRSASSQRNKGLPRRKREAEPREPLNQRWLRPSNRRRPKRSCNKTGRCQWAHRCGAGCAISPMARSSGARSSLTGCFRSVGVGLVPNRKPGRGRCAGRSRANSSPRAISE
jgi:hypothetical protein